MSKIKVSAELVPSQGCEGRICSRPLSGLLMAILMFALMFPLYLPIVFPLFVSLSKSPLFMRTPSLKTLPPNKVTFRGDGS